MIQEARPWLVDSRCRRARQCSGFLGSSRWVVSGSFGVLGSEFFSLGRSWCFLRLEIFIVLFVLFQVFRNFEGQRLGRQLCDWAGLNWFLSFFFNFLSSYRSLPLSAGPGVVPFVCLFAFFFLRPTDPPDSVLGHGLGNRAAKLSHGTVGFSC